MRFGKRVVMLFRRATKSRFSFSRRASSRHCRWIAILRSSKIVMILFPQVGGLEPPVGLFDWLGLFGCEFASFRYQRFGEGWRANRAHIQQHILRGFIAYAISELCDFNQFHDNNSYLVKKNFFFRHPKEYADFFRMQVFFLDSEKKFQENNSHLRINPI